MWWKIAIVASMFILMIVYGWWFAKDRMKYFNSRTYVYPKTGHRYYVEDFLKSKNPSTGEWYKAVRYFGLEDSKYYVREYGDFFAKFVLLKDWEDGRRQS